MTEQNTGFDIDSLFTQIDEMSTKLQNQVNTSTNKTGTTGNKDFKNVETSFLGGSIGTYEMKVFLDSDGKLFDDVYLHTIKLGNDKATVTCSGEDCPVCARVKKLTDLKNKAAWKFNKYKLNRLLVKIGDLPIGGVNGLKPGTVYLAYVDDKYFKTLIDSIKVNSKYFKDKLALMMDGKSNSAGFLVSASKAKKGVTHNFQFIDQLKISGVSAQEVFGVEKYKLANLGYFRSGFVSADKQKKAVSMLDSLIMNTIKTSGSSNTPVTETKTSNTQDPEPKHVEVEQSDSKIDTVDVSAFDPTSARDCKVIDPSTNNPTCFGYFETNMEMCTQKCSFKRSCMMEAMDNGTL